MAKDKTTKAGQIKATATKKRQLAGSAQFQSVGFSSNRARIYGTAADFSVDYTPTDRVEMIKRLRHGERNCGLVRQILNDYVTYVCGDGFTPQSHEKRTDVAALYEAYFMAWARNCDVTARFSFTEVLRITERGWKRDGDFFVLKVLDSDGKAKVQMVESHRVGNPVNKPAPDRMLDGISFDAQGRIVSVNVIQGDNSSKPVPANSVCHILEQDYCSGSRGLPLLQHSWGDIQSEDELLKLEMLAVKNDADVTRVLNKAGGFIPTNLKTELQGSGSANLETTASRMGGKLLALEPGESLTSLASNRPSPTFTGFLEAVQRDIARGSGLPYEFTSAPGSAGGAGLRLIASKADRSFSRDQAILIEKLCVPVWAFVIGTAIDNGELPDGDFTAVSWTTPKRITVDAGREAANDRADLELGLLSMSELYAQRGLDLRTEMSKRAKDFRFIMELAKAEGIPFWTLYKPGFNWLQDGQGKPTAAEVAMQGMDSQPPPDELPPQ